MKLGLGLLAIVLLLPIASAAQTIEVKAPLDSQNHIPVVILGEGTGFQNSFIFDTPPYNFTAINSTNSITHAALRATYAVPSTFNLHNDPGHTYTTTFIMNSTVFLTLTTIVHVRTTGILQVLEWEVCKQANYQDGTFFEATPQFCASKSVWADNPKQIQHSVIMDWKYDFTNQTWQGAVAKFYFSIQDETTPTSEGDSWNPQLWVPTFKDPVDLTNVSAPQFALGLHTLSVNLDSAADTTTDSLSYFITTYANDATAEGSVTGTGSDDCYVHISFFSLGPSITLPCSISTFMRQLMSGLNFLFGLFIGLFPGGSLVQTTFSQFFSLVIFVPLMLLSIFFNDPARWMVFILWYSALLGAVGFAFGAPIANIIEYPIAVLRGLGKFLVAAGKFLFDTAKALVIAIGAILP